MPKHYIQRICFSDHKGTINGVDELFEYDYMGAAEFEFGALNRILKSTMYKNLGIFKTQYKSDLGRGLFIVSTNDQVEMINNAISGFLKEDNVFEPTYLKDSLEIDKRNPSTVNRFCRFECWWDIHYGFFLCLGKDNAKKIIKGINAYTRRIENAV